MPTKDLYHRNPRDFALALVEEGMDPNTLLLGALKYMSHDDVRGMLDASELSPRFDEEDEEPTLACPDCGGYVTEQDNGRAPNYWTCDRDPDGNDGCAVFYTRRELTEEE